MFPEGGQTKKHCFLAIFPDSGRTCKHCVVTEIFKCSATIFSGLPRACNYRFWLFIHTHNIQYIYNTLYPYNLS
jgi:hypothetical protein